MHSFVSKYSFLPRLQSDGSYLSNLVLLDVDGGSWSCSREQAHLLTAILHTLPVVLYLIVQIDRCVCGVAHRSESIF